ncbi:hypothetical protein GGX14DRAFT_649599 [Mycena pura]|uniref:Polynucleotide 5'-hydroxyl-kinase GRC3 n=1 Tax=Mycena pura TaxID=153505 RepID=A0AAD7E2W6_9AGAR|nr:hypothetical protein GGX14DRAFT_649599 [Mycena pura]
MLSAFAARRAAHAANGRPDPHPSVLPLVTQPPIEPPPTQSKPNSKRKSSSKAPNSSRQRKKKRETELKKSRYSEHDSDIVNQSADVIVIDSDEEEGAEGDSSDPPPRNTRATAVGKRPWSPSAPIDDSSEDEVEGIPDDQVPPPSSHPTSYASSQTLSTFRVLPDENTFYLTPEEMMSLGLSTDTATLISLSPGQTISLLGTYLFTVLQGTVSICGVRISTSLGANRVFAPRSAPIPVLQASDETAAPHTISTISARLRVVFKSGSTVVALSQLNTGVEGLGRICPIFDGVFKLSSSRLQQGNNADYDLHLNSAQMLTQLNKDTQPFIFPETWKNALDSLSDSQSGIYLVKGQKNSGKSTFTRTLLNHLLCRYRNVAFLECDLGQSEFTPGGLVALNIINSPIFGPPFTHPTIPNFAHYLGTTTPKQSPSQYLTSIQSLVETYHLEVRTPADIDCEGDTRISDTIPLVANMMGWTKGLGADLMRRIEELVQPTDIFAIEPPSSESHSSSDPCGPKVHLLQPIGPSVLTANYTASDHRSIALLSYFHAVFPQTASRGLQQTTASRWNTTLPLCAFPPFEVDWSLAFDRVFLCGAGAEDVVSSEIDRVLDCALVGLVSCEQGSFGGDTHVVDMGLIPSIPYVQGAELPSPSISMCHGLALIRAISSSSSHMHILTPLLPHILANCRALVKGEMELPLWGMLDFRSSDDGEIAGVEKARVPYLQWDKGEGIGGEKRRVRRNLMRKAQR